MSAITACVIKINNSIEEKRDVRQSMQWDNNNNNGDDDDMMKEEDNRLDQAD